MDSTALSFLDFIKYVCFPDKRESSFVVIVCLFVKKGDMTLAESNKFEIIIILAQMLNSSACWELSLASDQRKWPWAELYWMVETLVVNKFPFAYFSWCFRPKWLPLNCRQLLSHTRIKTLGLICQRNSTIVQRILFLFLITFHTCFLSGSSMSCSFLNAQNWHRLTRLDGTK